MSRRQRIILRFLIGVMVATLLSWLAVITYIQTHKEQLLATVTQKLNQEIGGKLIIKDVELSIWHGFPNVSVVLKGVSIQDSLWEQHHHSLFEASSVYLRLSARKLISRKIEIKKITASQGSIYIYTNSQGYSNTSVFSARQPSKKKNISLRYFALENMRFILENKSKNKLFRVDCQEVDGTARKLRNIWHLKLDINARVHQFCFNTEKGSYLNNALIKGSLNLHYDTQAEVLEIPDQVLQADQEKISFAATFNTGIKPRTYSIHLHSNSVNFQKIASWLSPNISSKLDSIRFLHPVDLDGRIIGMMQFHDTPLIAVTWVVKDNTVQTPVDYFTKCSFKGRFYNEIIPGKGRGDDNSAVQLTEVKGKWMNIPFQSDSMTFFNITHPIASFDLKSAFPLSNLNNLSESMPFRFKQGYSSVILKYRGSIRRDDTLSPQIDGDIIFRNAAFVYLARNQQFSQANARLHFAGEDLHVHNVSVRSGESTLRMEGTALNILQFYFTDPQKVNIRWNIQSPLINLGDFITFIGKRKKTAKKKLPAKNKAHRILSQLDNVLNEADVAIDLNIDKLKYRQFIAQNITANAGMSGTNISLNHMNFLAANGIISLNAVINQDILNHPFKANATIQNVDVQKLFHAFENFGQEAIDENNVRGQLSANIDISGNLTENAKIINNSLNGLIGFELKNGAIINFGPFLKVSKVAFRKRDLSNVLLKDLSNRLYIHNSSVVIPQMNIVSTALYLNVKGVFAPPTGTDILLEVPLRNPEKDEQIKDDPNSIVAPKKKGIILYLRAQSGPDGKVRINWDPSRKQREKAAE